MTWRLAFPEHGSHSPMTVFNRAFRSAGLDWFARFLGGVNGPAGPSVPLTAIALDPDTPVSDDHPFPTKLPADQDPVFDHEAGVKVPDLTASAIVFTPPVGCKFARFDCSADAFFRTDDTAAADDGKATRVLAGAPEVLPVKPGVKVRGYAPAASIVRITPMKSR